MTETDKQKRIEQAIDGLLFDERQTAHRLDVEILVGAYRTACLMRDELQAKLDAVPVEAIIAYRANSDESEGLIRYGDHEAHADFAHATETLDAWLETQVTP